MVNTRINPFDSAGLHLNHIWLTRHPARLITEVSGIPESAICDRHEESRIPATRVFNTALKAKRTDREFLMRCFGVDDDEVSGGAAGLELQFFARSILSRIARKNLPALSQVASHRQKGDRIKSDPNCAICVLR